MAFRRRFASSIIPLLFGLLSPPSASIAVLPLTPQSGGGALSGSFSRAAFLGAASSSSSRGSGLSVGASPTPAAASQSFSPASAMPAAAFDRLPGQVPEMSIMPIHPNPAAVAAVVPAAAHQPGPPTVPFERPIDALACQELQRSIALVDHTTTNVSCELFQETSSSPRGCECHLVRRTATWLTCPYDCSDSVGAPGCVAGAASDLGLTGLTASRPQQVGPSELADHSDDPYTEVTLCTYWQWGSPDSLSPPRSGDSSPAPAAEGFASSSAEGRRLAEEAVRAAEAQAKAHEGELSKQLLSAAPAAFTLPPSLAGPAPAPGPALFSFAAPSPARNMIGRPGMH